MINQIEKNKQPSQSSLFPVFNEVKVELTFSASDNEQIPKSVILLFALFKNRNHFL